MALPPISPGWPQSTYPWPADPAKHCIRLAEDFEKVSSHGSTNARVMIPQSTFYYLLKSVKELAPRSTPAHSVTPTEDAVSSIIIRKGVWPCCTYPPPIDPAQHARVLQEGLQKVSRHIGGSKRMIPQELFHLFQLSVAELAAKLTWARYRQSHRRRSELHRWSRPIVIGYAFF